MRRAIAAAAVMALALTACGGGGGDSGDAPATTTPTTQAFAGDEGNGELLYQGTCIACHGADASGVEGLGKSLISDFVTGQSDAELVEFLKIGRPTSDPLNTTGVDMAPRGGNPSLTDADLLDIVAFLRSLN